MMSHEVDKEEDVGQLREQIMALAEENRSLHHDMHDVEQSASAAMKQSEILGKVLMWMDEYGMRPKEVLNSMRYLSQETESPDDAQTAEQVTPSSMFRDSGNETQLAGSPDVEDYVERRRQRDSRPPSQPRGVKTSTPVKQHTTRKSYASSNGFEGMTDRMSAAKENDVSVGGSPVSITRGGSRDNESRQLDETRLAGSPDIIETSSLGRNGYHGYGKIPDDERLSKPDDASQPITSTLMKSTRDGRHETTKLSSKKVVFKDEVVTDQSKVAQSYQRQLDSMKHYDRRDSSSTDKNHHHSKKEATSSHENYSARRTLRFDADEADRPSVDAIKLFDSRREYHNQTSREDSTEIREVEEFRREGAIVDSSTRSAVQSLENALHEIYKLNLEDELRITEVRRNAVGRLVAWKDAVSSEMKRLELGATKRSRESSSSSRSGSHAGKRTPCECSAAVVCKTPAYHANTERYGAAGKLEEAHRSYNKGSPGGRNSCDCSTNVCTMSANISEGPLTMSSFESRSGQGTDLKLEDLEDGHSMYARAPETLVKPELRGSSRGSYTPKSSTKLLSSSFMASPNTMIIGEVAFQLERAILARVFRGGSKQLTGYTLSNIEKMVSSHYDFRERPTITRQLLEIRHQLAICGWNEDHHPRVVGHLIRTYGLFPSNAKATSVARQRGWLEPRVLRQAVLLEVPREYLLDMIVILDCLFFLCKKYNVPLFAW